MWVGEPVVVKDIDRRTGIYNLQNFSNPPAPLLPPPPTTPPAPPPPTVPCRLKGQRSNWGLPLFQRLPVLLHVKLFECTHHGIPVYEFNYTTL